MAARNDQTLQIALIIFVGLTIVLGGFLVYVNRLKADYREQLATAQQDANEKGNAVRKMQTENESYRRFIGMGQNDNFETVEQQYQKDMQAFAGVLPAEEQKYRTIVERLDSEVTRSTDQETQAKQREAELKDRLLKVEAQKNKQIATIEEEFQKVKADAASERNKFDAARSDLEKKREELVTALNKQRDAYDKQIAELSAKVSDLDGQLASTIKSRQKLLDERAKDDPSFEVADGAISWVNQANRTVWINLGEEDSLRRQVTFSVYEQTEADAGKSEKKASIEVTRMLGDHMAEARITYDDDRNPILPGDWIYSPLWHEGKKIRFALTGVMDLDDDGQPDLQRAKDLIALNDGVVDATVTDDGSVEGEMTVETRYLVLGDYPSLPSQGALRTSWEDMTKEAQTLGVDTITLQEFLNQMGYKPVDRTVVLGQGARASDFTPKPSKFRPRSPYSTR